MSAIKSGYQSRRPRKSIKLDAVNPGDFRRYDLIFACEQCSHFAPVAGSCTIGYRAQHRRDDQLALYERTGKMAFCRFLEID